MSSYIRLDTLFPHREDEAYNLTADLAGATSKFPTVRGTGKYRTKIGYALARLCDCTVQYASGVSPQKGRALCETGLRACNTVLEALLALHVAGAVTDLPYQGAKSITDRLAAILTARISSADAAPREITVVDKQPMVPRTQSGRRAFRHADPLRGPEPLFKILFFNRDLKRDPDEPN